MANSHLLVGLRNRSTSLTEFRALDITTFGPGGYFKTLPDTIFNLIKSYDRDCIGVSGNDFKVFVEEIRIHWAETPGVPRSVKFETDLYETESGAVYGLLKLAVARGLGDMMMVEYNVWTLRNGDTGKESMYDVDRRLEGKDFDH